MTYERKVLLIEDDAFTRFMMRDIIANLGVEVEVAANGEEGCQILDDQPDAIGLVLMDVHMPRMSGPDAVRMIRNRDGHATRHVPIIAVTGDSRFHDKTRVEQLGMNGFASKPISPGVLLSLIDQYCAAA